ncbi:hypothetical protein D3C86_1599930 [compost metagenome]
MIPVIQGYFSRNSRLAKAKNPSAVAPSYSPTLRRMKFFIESVATTLALSPSLNDVNNFSPLTATLIFMPNSTLSRPVKPDSGISVIFVSGLA